MTTPLSLTLPEVATLPSAISRPRVLLVDDEEFNIDLLVDTLGCDYEIFFALEGVTALEIAAIKMPDLILMDVMMPGIDGYEVFRRLKADARTSEIPVIFFTCLDDVAAETRGLGLGAVDYITKPINPALVRARVSNQIKLKRAQDELIRLAVAEHLAQVADKLKRSAETDRIRRQELQQKDEFLSHVSHELRSPLTAIKQFTGILLGGLAGELNAEQLEYLQIVQRNVKQLQSMIDDLLEVTQAKTGKLRIELECTCVLEAIGETLRTLQGAAEAKQITLTSDAGDNLPSAYADPMRLRQIMIILLDNAIKFTPAGGAVTVQAGVSQKDPRFLLVEVSDTGCGLGPETAMRIFERLYQVSNTDEGGRKGMGLGLHIAKELVARLGGEIWVSSTPEKGSRFSFTVPIFLRQD